MVSGHNTEIDGIPILKSYIRENGVKVPNLIIASEFVKDWSDEQISEFVQNHFEVGDHELLREHTFTWITYRRAEH